jgi:hypothetical protein
MTLVQASPEIRELDIDVLRLTLRDLEDDPDGRPWPKTHIHATSVTLSGIDYARIVEILAPYSVTFEDGQYAVRFVGANTNVQDVTNVNQVSVRPNNSAGLISSSLIEFGAFDRGVCIDTVRGVAGTLMPTGTLKQPSNNVSDAMMIAQYRGLSRLYMLSSITLATGDNVQNMVISGQGMFRTEIHVEDGANVAGTEFSSCTLSGVMDGECRVMYCKMLDLSFVQGEILESMLAGEVTLTGSDPTQFIKCFDGLPGTGLPTIDCGGSGRSVGVWGWHGGLKIKNKTGPESISVNMDAGRVLIDSTVTDGNILVKGVGLCRPGIEDNHGGTADVDTNGLISDVRIKRIEDIEYGRWKIDRVTKQMTFYDPDDSVIATFDLKNADGDPDADNVYERVPV